MLTYGSLFSGIGGFDLGFDRAGMSCAWQVEIDDYCRRVLATHWPDVPKYKDVHDVGRHNLQPVDVIIGGFPCQPHSVAGKRQGAADDRNLWPEYLRIITELRPRWVVGENVFNIRNTILDDVHTDLENRGYTTIPLDLSSDAFGVPTLERHIWIIATANSERLQGGKCKQIQGIGGKPWELPRGYQRVPDRWAVSSSRVCGVGEGIPRRVDRLRGLGNAVVPQVAEWIGCVIVESES